MLPDRSPTAAGARSRRTLPGAGAAFVETGTFGMRNKIAMIAAAVLLAAIGALVTISGHFLGEALARAQLSRATAVAQGLAFQMERILVDVHDLEGFEQQCAEAVRANEGVAFSMVVSLNGEILFHSDPAQMHQALAPGALRQAIAAGAAVAEDRKLGLRYALVPVREHAAEPRAVVVVAYSQSVVDGARNTMMRTLLAVGIGVAIAGLLLLCAALAQYVNRPLNEVVQAIERFRSGAPLDALRVPRGAGTELAIMVHGFNGLLDRIAVRERELVAARDEAERGNRVKSEFLTMMSHELRTPMSAVLGMAELLESTPLSERQQRYLATIRSGSESLLRILDEILNLLRVETGDLSIQRAPFALRRLVEKTSALVQETANAKHLRLDVSIDEQVPAFVTGDAGRTRQIMLTLLGNALKFTERGGVTLRVTCAPGERIRFAVTDTGIGIDPAFRKEIFSAFAQADTGYARRYGGMGLGLSIAKRLCDAMEGTIDMESTPGKGSTFWFELYMPKALAEGAFEGGQPGMADAAHAPESQTASAGQARRKRVLVVEDNLLNQEVIAGYLEGTAYDMTFADDGRQAVDAYERERFDVVLMDWQMPEMDGLEATRCIREIETARRLPRTPIIAVTAHAMASDRATCLAAGMDDYIVKPYSIVALLSALDRWTAPRD